MTNDEPPPTTSRTGDGGKVERAEGAGVHRRGVASKEPDGEGARLASEARPGGNARVLSGAAHHANAQRAGRVGNVLSMHRCKWVAVRLIRWQQTGQEGKGGGNEAQ